MNGTTLNAMNENVDSALILAAKEGDNFLLFQIQFNSTSFDCKRQKFTFVNDIHIGHEKIVKLLFENGAHINAVNIDNRSALFSACDSGTM